MILWYLRQDFGGIYDCTNIVDGLVSIITDIGFDHMDILGDTIEKITENKAGIIKEGNDSVIYFQENITNIIEKKCKEKNNNFHLADKKQIKNYLLDKEIQKIDYKTHKDILINLKGKCQIFNTILCLECVDILREKGYGIDEETVREALKTIVHKARFETLNRVPKMIFDGGHNENAIKNLKSTVNEYYPSERKVYIVSILKSKDYKTAIKLLTEEKKSIFIFTNRK